MNKRLVLTVCIAVAGLVAPLAAQQPTAAAKPARPPAVPSVKGGRVLPVPATPAGPTAAVPVPQTPPHTAPAVRPGAPDCGSAVPPSPAPLAAAPSPSRRYKKPASPGRPPVAVRLNYPAELTADQTQVVLSFEIYRIRGDISGETSLTDNLWQGIDDKVDPVRGRFSFFTLAKLKVAGVEFRADEDGWTWAGKPKPPAGNKIEMIASPKVMLLPDNPFEITIGSQQPIQYFEKRPDGLFELKMIHEQTGLSVSGTVKAGENDRVALWDLTLSLSSIESRQPIEGVVLDVGAPIISKREYRTTIAVEPGRDYGMQLATEGYGFLIVRLKAEVVEAPSKKTRSRVVPPRPRVPGTRPQTPPAPPPSPVMPPSPPPTGSTQPRRPDDVGP